MSAVTAGAEVVHTGGPSPAFLELLLGGGERHYRKDQIDKVLTDGEKSMNEVNKALSLRSQP